MPTPTSGHDQLVQWLREQATSLTSLDPAASLEDLEPLRDIVGDARMVAVGESSHFIREFSLARHRILRFLVERCGFTVYALEFGFSEGFPLDTWVGGAGQDDDFDRLSGVAVPWVVSDSLRWLRQYNHTAVYPVRFAGIDIPEAGGSLLPALTPLADYLRDVDPEALPMLDSARGIAERVAASSMALAAPAWAQLQTAEQDALSAVLARLLIRFRSVEPLHVARSDQRSYDVALRRLEGACHTDYHLRAMADLYAGHGLAADASAREVYMAGSVRWHLDHFDPGTRIVLNAHNAHIQKVPVTYDGSPHSPAHGSAPAPHARRGLRRSRPHQPGRPDRRDAPRRHRTVRLHRRQDRPRPTRTRKHRSRLHRRRTRPRPRRPPPSTPTRRRGP